MLIALFFKVAYWQLITSMFVHASIAHITGNMLFLLSSVLAAKKCSRFQNILGIYLTGGLVGNLLSLAFGPNFISVGASGAIFSLFGAIVIYLGAL